MPFRVRGTEDQQLWTIYAANRETADRIAELFLKAGYSDIEVEEMPDW